MGDIEDLVFDYICKANKKIAELSTAANDLLEKTGCNCDITSYVDDINDINSSLYILSKGWENIELTFGYKNFLLALFPEEDYDPAAATLEILQAYIDRYSMNDASVMVSPLFPSMKLGTGCCDGFIDTLYYNKTESDARYYPLNQNPAGYLTDVDLDGLATEGYVNSQGFLTGELDPTVPEYVKGITEVDIDNWNNKLSVETDPTVPEYVKDITEVDIDNWNSKLSVETDPTVPNYVKEISTFDISNWDEAYATTLTLTALFIPATIFTVLSFNRLGGYVVATEAQPLTGTNIALSIGGNVTFSKAVIFHSAASKPTFTGSGITVTEIGDYKSGEVNEIILFYNGSGRVIALYSGESTSNSKGMITRGTTVFTSDTLINASGFTWEVNGAEFSSGSIIGIPVTGLPSSGFRIDSLWGDSSGNVIYSQGSDSQNEVFTPYADRVLLSLLPRKSSGFVHPVYTPLDVNVTGSTGFVISRVSSDSIGSVIAIESKEITKDDVGLDQVDNTSDADKPISDDVQAAIESLDDRFLRKDISDNNGSNTATLGNLIVPGDVDFTAIPDEFTPDYSLSIMEDGSVVKSEWIDPARVDDLEIRVDILEESVLDWMHVVRPVQIEYPSMAAMIADQNNHVHGFLYWTEDTQSYYEYLGTTTETSADYRLLTGDGYVPIIKNTGVLVFEGGGFNSTTTVDIGAIRGYIIDNETDPFNPSQTYVEYAGGTSIAVPTLGSGTGTYVLLNSSGTIIFQNTFPTSQQRKENIYLFKIGHPAGLITVVINEPDFINSELAQFRDFFQAVNYVNRGVHPYPIASNLTFNTTGGSIVGSGINYVTDISSPNTLIVAPATPRAFVYRTQLGGSGTSTTFLTPGFYDNGGVVTAVGGSANRSTIQYIFLVPGAGVVIQYGQHIYGTLIDAVAAVGKESVIVYENLLFDAILIGVVALTRTATDLTNEDQAKFFRADIFGQLIGSSAGTSVTTLQRAYENSLIPQILTSIGALTVKNGGVSDNGVVFAIRSLSDIDTIQLLGNGRIVHEDAINANESATLGQVESLISDAAYTHPSYTPVSEIVSGAMVVASFSSDNIGSVTEFTTRELTLDDLSYSPVTAEDLGLDEFVGLSPETLPISDATQESLDGKASIVYVDNELSNKADKSYVDNELSAKADRTDLEPVSFSYPILWVFDGNIEKSITSGPEGEDWLISELVSARKGIAEWKDGIETYPDEYKIRIKDGWYLEIGEELKIDFKMIYS